LVVAVRASVPSMPPLRASPVAPACKVISSSVFCRIARPRSPFYLPFHRSGLHRVAPPTTPSADFCTAVRPPCGNLSPDSGTRHRPPEVRSTAFAARPSDLPPRPLIAMHFAIRISLVRPGRPRYPLLVHRAAALLHAFFRPRLATTPLHFANPSPLSGWIKDFHLQTVDQTRHTPEEPRRQGAASRRMAASPRVASILRNASRSLSSGAHSRDPLAMFLSMRHRARGPWFETALKKRLLTMRTPCRPRAKKIIHSHSGKDDAAIAW
jgi:hypothetical protein